MTKSKWTILIIMIKKVSSIMKDLKNLRLHNKQWKKGRNNQLSNKKNKSNNDKKVIENKMYLL